MEDREGAGDEMGPLHGRASRLPPLILRSSEADRIVSLQCPPMVLGPISQPVGSLDAINTSAGAVWAVVDAKEVPETTFPVWVDVRDIADIHVKGVTEDIAKGKRCVLVFSQSDLLVADDPREQLPLHCRTLRQHPNRFDRSQGLP